MAPDHPSATDTPTARTSRQQPSRTPCDRPRITDDEWDEFLGHFERRKVATGDLRPRVLAPRASTSTLPSLPHLWPSPPSGPASPRSATTSPPASPKPSAKAGTAKPKDSRSAWPAPSDKLAQIDRRSAPAGPVAIGMPAFARFSDGAPAGTSPAPGNRP